MLMRRSDKLAHQRQELPWSAGVRKQKGTSGEIEDLRQQIATTCLLWEFPTQQNDILGFFIPAWNSILTVANYIIGAI